MLLHVLHVLAFLLLKRCFLSQDLLSIDGDVNNNKQVSLHLDFFAILHNEIILSIERKILEPCNHLPRNLSLVKWTFSLDITCCNLGVKEDDLFFFYKSLLCMA